MPPRSKSALKERETVSTTTETKKMQPFEVLQAAMKEAREAEQREKEAEEARIRAQEEAERRAREEEERIAAERRARREAVGHIEGLEYPKKDPTFVMSESNRKLFDALLREGRKGIAPNVLMIGPQGCGKTQMAYEFAAHAELPLLKMVCPLVREPRDWFGYKTATEGSVQWIRSQFSQVVDRGGAVILLDEITRSVPSVLNSLLPLMDHTKAAFIEEVKEILKVGDEIYFFATANIGAQFTGAYGRIDSALADRFEARIEVNYLKENDEIQLLTKRTGIDPDVSKKLVKVATDVRRENATGGKLTETLSTRSLLAAAKLYRDMGAAAFEFTILPLFSSEGGKTSEQSHVMQLLQGQFGTELSVIGR